MKIGVFDSGVGGLSVANAIQAALPDYEILYADDHEHVPYGTRQPAEILGFVEPILEGLVNQGCEAIVIACNTVTTTLIDRLRQGVAVPLVAVEPMVKPAAKRTKSGIIAICATPTTLASPRYRYLKETYAKNLTVLEPDCRDWSAMIEFNEIDESKIDERIQAVLAQGADVIVLGCTHYHWIEAEIKEQVTGRAEVIQPEPAIIEQLKRVIAQLA